MSQIENIQNSYQRAMQKKDAILANTKALIEKKRKIELQLEANQRKVEKINFFLEKTKESLGSANS